MRNDKEENSKSLLTLWSRGKMVRRPRPMVKYDMNRHRSCLYRLLFSLGFIADPKCFLREIQGNVTKRIEKRGKEPGKSQKKSCLSFCFYLAICL